MVKNTRKILKRTHRRAKKKVRFLLRHPFLLPVSIFFISLFVGLFLFVILGAETGGAKDRRIVNLYIDGERQTVNTRAKTVGELFERLDAVSLRDEDIIEPSRETFIIEDNTQINVYRARPVSVIDGDRTITLFSAQRAPRLLAAEAGVKLLPEDEAVLHTATADLLDNTSPEQLIINRSKFIQVTIYGVIRQYRTLAETVSDVLAENNITVREGETVQPENLDTSVVQGMLIAVNAPGRKITAVTEPVPYERETVTDDSMEVGQRVLKSRGENGERAVIYEIIEENGVEVARNELQTVITKPPINEVYARGTKPATLSPSVSVSEDKIALMAEAGIAAADYPYVDFIISHESGWRPGAYNAGSGAYGLCQSLPASKMASAGADYMTNPVTQLRWCNGYSSRYGGWHGAYNAWLAQGWW